MAKTTGNSRSRGRVRPPPPDDAASRRFPRDGTQFRTLDQGGPQIESFVQRYYSDWADSLDPADRDVAWRYKDRGYAMVNDELRGIGILGMKPQVDRMVEALDRVIDSSAVPYNVVVYRGVHKDLGLDSRGYMSTTLNPNFGRRFAKDWGENGVMLKIKVRQGARAAAMDLISDREEGELLLPRDSKFKNVTPPRWDPELGVNVIEAELDD